MRRAEWLKSDMRHRSCRESLVVAIFLSSTLVFWASVCPKRNAMAGAYDSGAVLIVGGQVQIAETTGSAEVYKSSSGTFANTGSMQLSTSYRRPIAALHDGRVLVVGGDGGPSGTSNEAELYDPVSGTFVTTGSMQFARTHHSATTLNDGRVLVAGGAISPSAIKGESATLPNTAELFDPKVGRFSPAGPMLSARSGHAATLLKDGRVLLVGGMTGQAPDTAELYDTAADRFTSASTLDELRSAETATLLKNGEVLILCAASKGAAVADVYDPTSGSFRKAGTMNAIIDSRSALALGNGYTATLLDDGRVLIAGGRYWNGLPTDPMDGGATNSAEIYDPETKTFTAVGTMISPRWMHTATLLDDGRVLITGGCDGEETIKSSVLTVGVFKTTELFDPKTLKFSPGPDMSTPRLLHTAILIH